jgi:thioredoxin-like negative regulator of GroEL
VSSLTFIALWTAAVGASDPDSYAEAHRTTMKTGKPMVVMVSTDWCPPCQVMKRTIIPRLRQRPLFSRVAFAVVNPDREPELARELTGGGPVPQLVMYRKTRNGWRWQKLVGGQSVEAVEQFIQSAIAQDEGDDHDTDAAPADSGAKAPPDAEKGTG